MPDTWSVPWEVILEGAKTGDQPVPPGGGRGWIVRDVIAEDRQTYTVGHKATPEEWAQIQAPRETARPA